MGDGEIAKALLPYIRRANEVQQYEPLVAYHCRLYAKNRLMKIPLKEQTRAISDMLSSLMEQLSKDMESIQFSSMDSFYIKKFAQILFLRADKQERFGKADMRTAKTFYAASLFFEILVNFRELRPDVLQKQQYAAWRAAEIFKELKEKSKKTLKEESQSPPSPPSSANTSRNLHVGYKSLVLTPGLSTVDVVSSEFSTVGQKKGALEQDHTLSSNMLFGDASSDSSLFVRVGSSYSTATVHWEKEEVSEDDETFYDCSDAELSSLFSNDAEHEPDGTCNGSVDVANDLDATCNGFVDVANESYHPSPIDIAKAQKVAKLAVSALAFDDVPSAISYLEQALSLLTHKPQ